MRKRNFPFDNHSDSIPLVWLNRGEAHRRYCTAKSNSWITHAAKRKAKMYDCQFSRCERKCKWTTKEKKEEIKRHEMKKTQQKRWPSTIRPTLTPSKRVKTEKTAISLIQTRKHPEAWGEANALRGKHRSGHAPSSSYLAFAHHCLVSWMRKGREGGGGACDAKPHERLNRIPSARYIISARGRVGLPTVGKSCPLNSGLLQES